MGGSSFGKTFGKVTTTLVDPFGIRNTQFGKTVRKVVDPLNIVDPFNILPGKGEKWGTFDKNYALGLFNAPKNQGTYIPMTKGLSSNPQYFAQQQQMLNNMRQQQQSKLANLRTQDGLFSPSASTKAQPIQSTPDAATGTTLAQSKISDTNAPADMPTEFYKPTKATQAIAANTFQMPDMSNIKFGGA